MSRNPEKPCANKISHCLDARFSYKSNKSVGALFYFAVLLYSEARYTVGIRLHIGLLLVHIEKSAKYSSSVSMAINPPLL